MSNRIRFPRPPSKRHLRLQNENFSPFFLLSFFSLPSKNIGFDSGTSNNNFTQSVDPDVEAATIAAPKKDILSPTKRSASSQQYQDILHSKASSPAAAEQSADVPARQQQTKQFHIGPKDHIVHPAKTSVSVSSFSLS